MSFSKAKIIRFNDIIACTPSSTNYNLPKDRASDKSKNLKVNSTGNTSPATSENGSVKSVPGSFKTPTLPKKTKTATSATKVKPKDLFNNDLEALNEKTEECEKKTKYIHKLTEEIEGYKKDLEDLKAVKEQLQREHQNEMQELEFEMLKTMTQLQKQEEEGAIKLKGIEEKLTNEIKNLKRAHEYQVGQVVLDYEIKLKEFKEASEVELKARHEELEEIWKQKLQDQEKQSEAILKECQAISEYNIIQCELEKKQIKKSLEESTLAYESLQEKYNQLLSNQDQFDKSRIKTEQQLNNKIKCLSELIQEKEEEVKKLNGDIKAYQLTLSNCRMTIEVLKKRLIDSDQDVEQLKQEMSRYDQKLISYEGRYFQLNTELQEAKEFNEELELQYEAATKCHERSINQLKKELLGRVCDYEMLVKQYQGKEEEQLKEQITEQAKLIKQINIQLKNLEGTVDGYIAKEKTWREKVNELNEDNIKTSNVVTQKEMAIKELKEQLKELSEKNEDLNDKCSYYKTRSEEFEGKAKESSQTMKKYISVSGKYENLLQDFEILKLENEAYENKIVGLSTKMESLLKMEETCDQLKKDKERLESENVSIKNKFEEQKLKKFKFAAKDKENLGSPNRSAIESPNRGSPFRERN